MTGVRFAVETTGTLISADVVADRSALDAVFDHVAEALARACEFEADVAVNLDSAQLEFYIVVEAADTREAFAIADKLIDRAMAASGVRVAWNEAHARRSDLLPV